MATLAGYSAFLAVVSAVGALRGRRVAAAAAGWVTLELLLVAQAGLDLAAWARGGSVREPATHAGYLAASVALIPLLASGFGGSARSGPTGRRWDDAVLAVAGVTVSVVCLRLRQTRG